MAKQNLFYYTHLKATKHVEQKIKMFLPFLFCYDMMNVSEIKFPFNYLLDTAAIYLYIVLNMYNQNEKIQIINFFDNIILLSHLFQRN